MASASSRFCGNKAGVDPLDKSRIQRIIDENTSQNFGNHEQKRGKRIEERVQKNKELVAKITSEQLEEAQNELDKIILELEGRRQLNRYRVHIDMDAFFAAVECRDNSSLRTIPMAVGSDAMLSTSNYLARKFGVRSAMPGFIGKKLCPHITIVPGNYSKYRKESQVIRTIFERFDPNVSMGSLDEAYLDITEFIARRDLPVNCKRTRYAGECVCRLPLLNENEQTDESMNAERITEICAKCKKERILVVDSIEFGMDVNSVVQQIRFEVEQATGLTCSAGIAANGMLAKICSDLNKPNGQFYLENDRQKIVEFMQNLPIRKVPGIGPVSEAVLKALGVETCGHLLQKGPILRLLFYQHYSEWLLRVSLGISGGNADQGEANDEDGGPKSTSIERTFSPKKDLAELLQILRNLCGKLIDSMPSEGIYGGRAATLKIKFSTFDVITRCKSVDFPIRTTEILYPIMEGLLKRELKERGISIRLLGVRLSNLIFSENISEEDKRISDSKGVQKSLMDFMRPSTSSSAAGPPILIELSDTEENGENIGGEEDVLNASFEGESEMDADLLGNGKDEQMEMDENENGENNELEAAETSSDAEEVIFVEKIEGKKRKNKMVVPVKRNQKKKKKSSKNAKQTPKRGTLRPKGMKDLREYFPTVL